MGILFLLAGIDRGAVSNASIFGFKESLGINTTQYNLIATVSSCPQIVAARTDDPVFLLYLFHL